MQTIIRRAGLVLVSVAVMLGLNVGTASAATESRAAMAGHSTQTSDGAFNPGDCRAINLAANVSNLGVGYIFHGRCNPPHVIFVTLDWYDAQDNFLTSMQDRWLPGIPGTWLTYQKSVPRPSIAGPGGAAQTAKVCISVTQDGTWPLTSGCFPRNS
jgi:hypothetical protein